MVELRAIEFPHDLGVARHTPSCRSKESPCVLCVLPSCPCVPLVVLVSPLLSWLFSIVVLVVFPCSLCLLQWFMYVFSLVLFWFSPLCSPLCSLCCPVCSLCCPFFCLISCFLCFSHVFLGLSWVFLVFSVGVFVFCQCFLLWVIFVFSLCLCVLACFLYVCFLFCMFSSAFFVFSLGFFVFSPVVFSQVLSFFLPCCLCGLPCCLCGLPCCPCFLPCCLFVHPLHLCFHPCCHCFLPCVFVLSLVFHVFLLVFFVFTNVFDVHSAARALLSCRLPPACSDSRILLLSAAPDTRGTVGGTPFVFGWLCGVAPVREPGGKGVQFLEHGSPGSKWQRSCPLRKAALRGETKVATSPSQPACATSTLHGMFPKHSGFLDTVGQRDARVNGRCLLPLVRTVELCELRHFLILGFSAARRFGLLRGCETALCRLPAGRTTLWERPRTRWMTILDIPRAWLDRSSRHASFDFHPHLPPATHSQAPSWECLPTGAGIKSHWPSTRVQMQHDKTYTNKAT